MECEHENSAGCISPPLDATVLYWSGPEDYSALCECVKESVPGPVVPVVCIHCSKKCGKCQNTLDQVCAVGGGFRRCLECGFVMCQGCWYDLHGQQAVNICVSRIDYSLSEVDSYWKFS